MEIISRSCMKAKKLAFSQQIDKFSWQIRHGPYVSPTYYFKSTGFVCCLVIESTVQESNSKPFFCISSQPYCEYIEISLRRMGCEKENQLIDIHLIIVDSFNICWFCASKEIYFTPSFKEETVLRMRKSDLFHGCCGLNKVRFIPNDILTIKCEITVYETAEENYTSEDELEDTAKYVKEEMLDMFLILLAILAIADVFLSINFQVQISFTGAIFAILVLWNFGCPGGDRTSDKSQGLIENQQK